MAMKLIHRKLIRSDYCNLLVLLGTLLFSAVIPMAQADLYSWKDASGVTHYSDSPPPEGTADVRHVQEKGASPDLAKQANDIERKILEDNKGFEERQKKRDDEAKQTAGKQQDAARKQAACEESRAYLRTLQSGTRLTVYDAAGKQSFMSPEQIQAKTAETNKLIQDNCS